MGLHLPGLNEALSKLDTTTEQMEKLVEGIEKVVVLLEEQNELFRNR